MNAPLDTVPMFVKAGSVIPVLDPRIHTLNNATNTSVITWDKMKVCVHMCLSVRIIIYYVLLDVPFEL